MAKPAGVIVITLAYPGGHIGAGTTPSQQNYITNSNAGEGLIFYGSTIVPFKDDFPKDTQLYRIMTTRLEETTQN